MEITHLGGRPYSEELAERRAGEDFRHRIPTVLFSKDDSEGANLLVLPPNSGMTVLQNHTNYFGTPRSNRLKDFWSGKLRTADPGSLDGFLRFLTDRISTKELDVSRTVYMSEAHCADYGTGKRARVVPGIRETAEYEASPSGIASLEYDFVGATNHSFMIDPLSDLRFEERTLRDGRKIFVAYLSVQEYIADHGEPGFLNLIRQKIEAKEKK